MCRKCLLTALIAGCNESAAACMHNSLAEWNIVIDIEPVTTLLAIVIIIWVEIERLVRLLSLFYPSRSHLIASRNRRRCQLKMNFVAKKKTGKRTSRANAGQAWEHDENVQRRFYMMPLWNFEPVTRLISSSVDMCTHMTISSLSLSNITNRSYQCTSKSSYFPFVIIKPLFHVQQPWRCTSNGDNWRERRAADICSALRETRDWTMKIAVGWLNNSNIFPKSKVREKEKGKIPTANWKSHPCSF